MRKTRKSYNKLSVIAFTFIIATICSWAVNAKDRYVTDDFEIMLRVGPSMQTKIIGALRSGTKIKVLNDDAGNGHSQVQTEKGEIGYLLTRFITKRPAAKQRVKYLQARLKKLQSDPTQVRTLLANSQDENTQLISSNARLTSELNKVQKEYEYLKEVSSNTVEITEENQRLKDEVRQLILQLDDMRIQSENLKDQSNKMWAIYGGGLVVIGLLFGWILSLAQGARRKSWGS